MLALVAGITTDTTLAVYLHAELRGRLFQVVLTCAGQRASVSLVVLCGVLTVSSLCVALV